MRAATMSRIKLRSAKSLVVNHEKPKAVSALLGGNGVITRHSPRQARSRSSRARKKGSPSRNTGSETAASSGPSRRTPIRTTAFLFSSSNRIGWLNGVVRRRSQSKRARLAGSPNSPASSNKARHRHGLTIDQISATYRPDFGINAVLRAEAKEASRARSRARRRRRPAGG